MITPTRLKVLEAARDGRLWCDKQQRSDRYTIGRGLGSVPVREATISPLLNAGLLKQGKAHEWLIRISLTDAGVEELKQAPALVIGLCGPSSSGKSTLAKNLTAHFNAKHLCLDKYWAPPHLAEKPILPIVNGFPSYERPHLYNGPKFAVDLATAKVSNPVIAEGFLLFSFPEILSQCSVKVFLDLTDCEIMARRARRAASKRGKTQTVERSFAANGLPEWHRYGAPQACLEGVRRVDASLPPDALLAVVLNVISAHPGVEMLRAG